MTLRIAQLAGFGAGGVARICENGLGLSHGQWFVMGLPVLQPYPRPIWSLAVQPHTEHLSRYCDASAFLSNRSDLCTLYS
jgi:hypothetical protein